MLADVWTFSFSSSFRGRGQLESRAGSRVSCGELTTLVVLARGGELKSITGLETGAGGGILTVGVRGGELTTLSGDGFSVVESRGGMGKEMDEGVCSVVRTSLRKTKQTVNSDAYDSVSRGGKQMKFGWPYPLVVGICLVRLGLMPAFLTLLA